MKAFGVLYNNVLFLLVDEKLDSALFMLGLYVERTEKIEGAQVIFETEVDSLSVLNEKSRVFMCEEIESIITKNVRFAHELETFRRKERIKKAGSPG